MKLSVFGAGPTYAPELVDGIVRMRDLLPVEALVFRGGLAADVVG